MNLIEQYQKIYHTYLEQQQALEQEDWEKLEEILNKRDSLMKDLEGKTVPEESQGEIKEILQKTLELHTQLQTEMEERLKESKQKRGEINKGKKLYQAYNQNPNHSLFLDRKK
ncbi:flagellar protein FliT [Anaerobranca gottschalkii]|uniref:Flagellar protein FliT n=1 Tax=Anaerobranca gottschalkii DSM 13577 TaxID=1120990 RepID=A0A1H9ZHE1_9FIRM|nr:flagellar protein FliT [Anaerobranca gottschalkii]SES81010.1 protein FliT [Anaerobranca gottschalkii DSM 13577]